MISHAHRAIFVHIPKTGGSSIEQILWPPSVPRSLDDLWMGFVDDYSNAYQTGGLQHLLARHIRDAVGASTFASYYSFAIVRNPWDRIVSQYTYMHKRKDLRDFVGMRQDTSLNEYLDLIARRKHVQWEAQFEFVTDEDGNEIVDYVGRFEHLKESTDHVLHKLGLPREPLGHEKRGDRGPYQDYYDDESREKVAAMFRRDVELFDYQFRPATNASRGRMTK